MSGNFKQQLSAACMYDRERLLFSLSRDVHFFKFTRVTAIALIFVSTRRLISHTRTRLAGSSNRVFYYITL